jgi:hypothetical protein
MGEKLCLLGRDRLFYPVLFNVMISRFFTKKKRERENRGKKNGKTGNGDYPALNLNIKSNFKFKTDLTSASAAVLSFSRRSCLLFDRSQTSNRPTNR